MKIQVLLVFTTVICTACTDRSDVKDTPEAVQKIESTRSDSIYIKSETIENDGHLVSDIVIWNDGASPAYLRADYYYVEWYGDERGVTLPAREWSGNVVSRIHPSKYGSLGQNQVGPFVPRRPILLKINPKGRINLTVNLDIPEGLSTKNLKGDSISVSIPYWKSLQSIDQFVKIHPVVDSFLVSDSVLQKVDMKNYVSYTLRGDSIALNLEQISMLNASISDRLHAWSVVR